MSHRNVITITIIIWSILGIVPFLAYTQKSPISPVKKVEQLNTITYINTGHENDYSWIFIDNLFESKEFVGQYPIASKELLETTPYDTGHDWSVTKYVSRHIPLQNKTYVPSELITIESEYLTTSQKNFKLRADAAAELIIMAQEFYEIFDKKLVIVSAYRSHGYQSNLRKNWCPNTLCAPAGHSEHQLGLAVDLFAATTADKFLSKADFKKYYDWLAVNAHRYGRHNTYQKWVEIDTYQVEPRHWRYIWRELATELYNQKMTFWEWISKQKK